MAVSGQQVRGARAARRARRAAGAVRLAERQSAERAADLQRRRRRRRAQALMVLGSTIVCAVVVSWVAAQMAGVHPYSQMRWMIGLGGRHGGFIEAYYIATADAWWFALAVQSVPAVLAAASLLLVVCRRASEGVFDVAPMWLGAVLAPGLAIGLLGGFAAHAAGLSPDDAWPVLAAFAPQGLPLVGVSAAVAGVFAWRRLRGR